MEILRDPLGRDDFPAQAVVSIGNFDGVHLGHRQVIKESIARAREIGAPAVLLTFEPHPVAVLRPEDAPPLLMKMEQRLELFSTFDLDAVAIIPFTNKVARMDALSFIRNVLVERFRVREVYTGANFRFGMNREGDVELLQILGQELGFRAEAWPTVLVDDAPVSSTRIRSLVAGGELESAWKLLGHPHFGDGEVLLGKRLGRKLGFPTMNIALEKVMMPAEGVYITAVHIPSFQSIFQSVTNVGVRPTVYENSGVTIESHLMDFTADVYNERVRIFFLRRLRDEEVFNSTLQLVAQVRRDVEEARLWFYSHPIDSIPLVRR